MNVLKQHLQTIVSTLLAAGKSLREIERITGVNRKTIRSLAQRTDVSNSPGVASHRSRAANYSTPATDY